MINRSSGVLLHISSLPGEYGIGSFGKEAVAFAQLLHDCGFSYWQTLPFLTVDQYNSPYTSLSAFAGNPLFIDLPTLYKDGLLTREELEANKYPNPYSVDFKWLRETRDGALRRAFSRADEALREKVRAFAEENGYWLPDYALYAVLKEKNELKWWPDWEDKGLKSHRPEAVERAKAEYADEILYQEFVQYEFYTQWKAIKKQINEIGIRIIGDMPFYIAQDSADVWGKREMFDIDLAGKARRVSGCPPDYFSADGQLWGQPIYNWAYLKEHGYDWWMRRLGFSLQIYDMVRIDHFRAFSSYWSVPGDALTAKEGKWVEGAGMDFFDRVKLIFGENAPIIAEDLGLLDDGVINLIRDTGLPGMRVLQFAFIDNYDNIHLPHNIPKNAIAYTGTHDNDTAFGWLYGTSPENRERALRYCGFEGDNWGEGGYKAPAVRAMIRALWASPAMLAIAPIQDLCGFGGDCKMNQPGIPDGNWAFRITDDALHQMDAEWIRKTNRTYFRSSI